MFWLPFFFWIKAKKVFYTSVLCKCWLFTWCIRHTCVGIAELCIVTTSGEWRRCYPLLIVVNLRPKRSPHRREFLKASSTPGLLWDRISLLSIPRAIYLFKMAKMPPHWTFSISSSSCWCCCCCGDTAAFKLRKYTITRLQIASFPRLNNRHS